MKRLSRRTLLRGAGSIAVALPWLEAMEARAQTPPKKRFVGVFTPCGIVPATWYPTGSGAAFTLNSATTPLEPHKAKLLFFENISNKAALNGPGNAHARGTALLFTGHSLSPEPLFGEAGWNQGISVDQEIAKAIGGATRFKSLEFGVQVNQNTNTGRISYAGPNLPLEPQNNPKVAFDRIFSGVTGGGTPDPAAEALRLQRKSILDSVKADFAALKGTLGTQDNQRLDAHLTSIRELERELIDVLPPAAGCVKPADPATSDPAVVADFMREANFPRVGALQTKLLVTALKCDLTRVATLMWSRGVSLVVHSWAGAGTTNHHALSHLIEDTQTARDNHTKITTWYSQQFASLLAQMDEVVEPNGKTLLDNSVVLWGNELSNGDTHSRNNIPFVLAGSGGGYFRTGRYMKYANTPHNNLLVSCLNAMGVPATTFGKPEFCTGPLSGLTA